MAKFLQLGRKIERTVIKERCRQEYFCAKHRFCYITKRRSLLNLLCFGVALNIKQLDSG